LACLIVPTAEQQSWQLVCSFSITHDCVVHFAFPTMIVEPTTATTNVDAWDDTPTDDSQDDGKWLRAAESDRSIFKDLREIFCEELWAYRGLAYELTRRDIRIRYKQAVMGLAWAVLVPGLIVVSGGLVRFAMAFVSGRHVAMQELAGMAFKALPWSFFVGALGFATNTLIANSNLVTKIYFPRELLPLAATFAQAFDSSIGAITVLLIAPLLGVHYGAAIAWAPVLALLTFLFTTGAALLASCANLFFRDVKYLVQVLLTFGIFFTPVFFEPEMFGPTGSRLMMLNPLAPLLEGMRLAVVQDHSLFESLVVIGRKGALVAWSPWYLAYAAAWAIGIFIIGLVVFHRSEAKFAEYV
jgi:lipopolysaccharide transport system permease protein